MENLKVLPKALVFLEKKGKRSVFDNIKYQQSTHIVLHKHSEKANKYEKRKVDYHTES